MSVSVLRPEEVHLQQADALDLLHRPLRRDFVAVALVERRVVGDRSGRDDHAGGVDAGVAATCPRGGCPMSSSSLTRGSWSCICFRTGFSIERLLQRHVERGRDLLGDAVDFRVRHVHGAADVAHHGLGLHRAEGDDLRDVLAAVLPGDVVDDLAAAALAEVDVDIGQRHALGVEEALEQQVVVQRIDVGDLQAPRRPGCRRPSRGPGRPECPARGRSG